MLFDLPLLPLEVLYEPSAIAGLLKIALLLVTAFSVHLSLSPPNPPVPKAQYIEHKSLFERCVRHITFCSKMMVWVETLCDALATFATIYPAFPFSPLLARALLPPIPPIPTLTTLHPLLALGALAALAGAVLRLACFRTLGPLFTFELTIAPAHALVTEGPYAVVRHPSYTGVVLTLLGASAVALAPGAWLRAALGARAASWAGAAAWAALAFWIVKIAYALRCTLVRLVREDGELHRVFGERWEAYAARVRWRLVPGVY